MNSSFFDNIRFNNIQQEIKQLQTAVSDLEINTGNTGAGIVGDLNLNNHNLTDVNTLNFNGGASITTYGGEGIYLNGFYTYLGGGLEGQGNYIHNISDFSCNTFNAGSTATIQNLTANSINLPYNNVITGITGAVTINGSSVLLSPISSDLNLNNHNLTNVNQINLGDGVSMSTNGTYGLTVDASSKPINLNADYIFLNGGVECGSNHIHAVSDIACETMEASTSLTAPIANVTTANLTTANVGTLDLGNGVSMVSGSTNGLSINTVSSQINLNSSYIFLNGGIECGSNHIHNVGDISCVTAEASTSLTAPTVNVGDVAVTSGSGNLLLGTGNAVLTQNNFLTYFPDSGSGSGFAPTATENLNMNNYDITNCGTLELSGKTLVSDPTALASGNNCVVIREASSITQTISLSQSENFSNIANNTPYQFPFKTNSQPILDWLGSDFTLNVSLDFASGGIMSEMTLIINVSGTSNETIYPNDALFQINAMPLEGGGQSTFLTNFVFNKDTTGANYVNNLNSPTIAGYTGPIQWWYTLILQGQEDNGQGQNLFGSVSLGTSTPSWGDIDIQGSSLVLSGLNLQSDGTNLSFNGDTILTNNIETGNVLSTTLLSNPVNAVIPSFYVDQPSQKFIKYQLYRSTSAVPGTDAYVGIPIAVNSNNFIECNIICKVSGALKYSCYVVNNNGTQTMYAASQQIIYTAGSVITAFSGQADPLGISNMFYLNWSVGANENIVVLFDITSISNA